MAGMNGDLSLSQSLGGLRIANPDDSTLQSEDATVDLTDSTSSEQPADSVSTYPQIPAPDDQHSVAFPPAPTEVLVSNEIREPAIQPPEASPPHISTSYQQQPYLTQPHSTPQSHSRPLSSVYTNGSTPAVLDNHYRIRTDSGASSNSQSRIDSRAAQAGVLARDNSHSDRSYRAGQLSANGSVSMRHSSSRSHARGTTAQMSRSPYAMENGPVSSSEDWQDRGAAVSVRQEVDANGKTVSRFVKKGVRDFSFGNTLGEGSYSTVVFATDRQTLKEYAIKILDKRHIIKEKKVKYVNIEKDTLNRLTDHPGIVRLYYTFQDERSLYFVLDLCKGGELLGVLKRMTTFDEECTRFYSAQILDAIDYMHKRGVIHRDLKPENVLLDHQMHVKITDFGTAKILKGTTRRPNESGTSISSPLDSSDILEEERASSFVGTAEYVSPELLTDKNACKASDLWAFGCIIYQLLAGRPPFKAGNEYQTFQKIVALDYEFPIGFPSVARDLVERLLVLDPTRRLQIEHIKNHEFFRGITWGTEMWKQKAPRLKAYVPPPREPIKLNGESGETFPPVSTAPSTASTSTQRPLPRVVTELPPPSQLDIEWSPVLNKANERILKLGNMMVLSSPASHSPSSKYGSEPEAPKKFSRFFTGSTTKKRSRLVMVTSTARIIMAAAGGDEKKAKLEISLLSPGTHWRSTTDVKGRSCWIVDTRDKHFVFEDPKPSSSNIGATALSAQEWLDSLDRAREMALVQQSSGTMSAEDAFRDMSSTGFSSHSNITLDHKSESNVPPPSRNTLQKHQPQSNDTDSVKGRKRFSRRHSKNSLAAVF